MRIMGFSKKWDKLQQTTFTTFRYRRKDSDRGFDWHNGETLKIVYHPRHEHEYLGIAQVILKETKQLADITHEESVVDGFINLYDMFKWLGKSHKGMDMFQPINKLTLKWIERA